MLHLLENGNMVRRIENSLQFSYQASRDNRASAKLSGFQYKKKILSSPALTNENFYNNNMVLAMASFRSVHFP